MLQNVYYGKYIKGTPHLSTIVVERGLLCKVKPSLLEVIDSHISCANREVFLNTISLKHIHDRHIYDKKNPQVFFLILRNLPAIIKRPDELRRNKQSKRGDFLFVKKIDDQPYFVSVEIAEGAMELVSSSATGTNYLKKFPLLWSWGTANSPS